MLYPDGTWANKGLYGPPGTSRGKVWAGVGHLKCAFRYKDYDGKNATIAKAKKQGWKIVKITPAGLFYLTIEEFFDGK